MTTCVVKKKRLATLDFSKLGEWMDLPISLVAHGGSDFAETCNVGAGDERWELAICALDVLLGCLEAVVESGFHDAL